MTTVDKDAVFFSLDNIEKTPGYEKLATKMIEIFKNISSISQQSRLRMKGDFEKELSQIATSEEMMDYMASCASFLPELSNDKIVGGTLINKNKTICLLGIEGKWICLKENVQLIDILIRFWCRARNKNTLTYTGSHHINFRC